MYTAPGHAASTPALTGPEARLLAYLGEGETPLDELVRRSGLPSAEVTAAMTMLAIKGQVVQRPGGLFAARSPRQ